jgi:hypothetical protein
MSKHHHPWYRRALAAVLITRGRAKRKQRRTSR